MKKKVQFSIQHQHPLADEITTLTLLPNKIVRAIGPFVLLEQILSSAQSPDESHKDVVGKCPSPHRGIIILSYILSGEVEHVDSLGNHVKLSSGGVHWMKAGKGAIHDEAISAECTITNKDISVIRFWINLPSKYKSEDPQYFSLEANDIP